MLTFWFGVYLTSHLLILAPLIQLVTGPDEYPSVQRRRKRQLTVALAFNATAALMMWVSM